MSGLGARGGSSGGASFTQKPRARPRTQRGGGEANVARASGGGGSLDPTPGTVPVPVPGILGPAPIGKPHV